MPVMVTGGDNYAFVISNKSVTISENEDLIPHASVHAIQNNNLTRVELVVNLPTIGRGYFTSGGQRVE